MLTSMPALVRLQRQAVGNQHARRLCRAAARNSSLPGGTSATLPSAPPTAIEPRKMPTNTNMEWATAAPVTGAWRKVERERKRTMDTASFSSDSPSTRANRSVSAPSRWNTASTVTCGGGSGLNGVQQRRQRCVAGCVQWRRRAGRGCKGRC